MNWTVRITEEDRLGMSSYTRQDLLKFNKENPGMTYKLVPNLPESSQLRRYYHGCLIALCTFFQENLDYRKSTDRDLMHEWVKTEFNADFVVIDGKSQKVPLSTRGREQLKRVVEKVTEYLETEHACPDVALSPEKYEAWRDTIFPYGGPDNYIDYLVQIKVLTPN